MAGHSKWANIKHKKERADAKKGKVFSRVAKEIISAVKVGGGDPKGNPRLRLALQKAKTANVPNDVVDRNIKKGLSQDQADFEEVTYELYGYGGVGLIVEAMTDNRNRMASEIRIATNKRGGNIATPGAVSFNFDRKGVIQVEKSAISEDDLFLLISDLGAEDFESEGDLYLITTDPADLIRIKEGLEEKGIETKEATFEMIPKTLIECSEEDQQKTQALIDWLEEIEDVDAVYHNIDE